jgi:hypothetical protein
VGFLLPYVGFPEHGGVSWEKTGELCTILQQDPSMGQGKWREENELGAPR